MTEKLKQNLKEQLEFLPKESQEAINSFDWVKISEEIGKKYYLTEDEISILQADIGCVLVGIAEQEYLAEDIEDDIGTSKNQAQQILNDLVQKIIKPIYDILAQNIKNSIKTRNISWKQSVDFILSGGDYTAFIRRDENESLDKTPKKEYLPQNRSKISDLKSKFTI